MPVMIAEKSSRRTRSAAARDEFDVSFQPGDCVFRHTHTFHRNLGATGHSDPDVRPFERRGIVDAVASDGHGAPVVLEPPDDLEFLLRCRAGKDDLVELRKIVSVHVYSLEESACLP